MDSECKIIFDTKEYQEMIVVMQQLLWDTSYISIDLNSDLDHVAMAGYQGITSQILFLGKEKNKINKIGELTKIYLFIKSDYGEYIMSNLPSEYVESLNKIQKQCLIIIPMSEF